MKKVICVILIVLCHTLAWAQSGQQTMGSWCAIREGLRQTDPHKDSLGRKDELYSRFHSQRLQTILGTTFAWNYKNLGVGGKFRGISYRDGTAVVATGGNWTAMTMGNFIIGGKGLENDISNKTYQHEYGHYIQSQSLGPYYVMLIAIPSIMSKVIYKGDHHFSPTEQDANIRAYNYFSTYYPGEFIWDFESNPILGMETGVYPVIAPTKFDRVIYTLNPIIGTLVGGVVHGARKNEK